VFAQVMGKGAEHAYKVVLIKEVIASDLILKCRSCRSKDGQTWEWPDLAGNG